MKKNILFVLLILFCNTIPTKKHNRVSGNNIKKVNNNNTATIQAHKRELKITNQKITERQRYESLQYMSNYTQLLENELNITRRTDISPSTKWLLKSMLYK